MDFLDCCKYGEFQQTSSVKYLVMILKENLSQSNHYDFMNNLKYYIHSD
jgi:hypothetical protein